jgi:hypothetical protein
VNETPVIPAGAFQGFRDLLSLIGNEKRAMRTLNQLEDRLAKVAEAEQRLAERSAAFDQASSKTRAELEDKAAKLRAKELALMGRESMAERIIDRDKTAFHDRNRPLAEGFTISREPA